MKPLEVRGEDGLSLVEVMVALTILAVMTLGITPLLAGTLRGTSLTRTRTSGKNIATEAMERVRGLPFFESVQGQTTPQRRDVLDIFFPDRGTGFDSATNTFKTTCTSIPPAPGTRQLIACPKNIPNGYTVTFVAAFVKPGSGTPQTFTVEPPSASYNWSSTTSEKPPAQLLRMSITVAWTYGNQPQSFNLTSLIGQRAVSPETLSGGGQVDYSVRVLASYFDSAGAASRLVATFGESDSHMATRGYAQANEKTNAGHLVLTKQAVGETSAVTQADVSGASSAVTAPPNSYPAPSGTPPGERTVLYQYDASTQLPIAFIDDTVVEGPSPFSLGAQITNELPKAAGKFRYSGTDAQSSFWVDNQAQRGLLSPLKLDDSGHLIAGEPGGTRLTGQSSTEATALSSGRKVESKASASFGKLLVFPTTFISHPDDAVLTISNFTSSLTCTSTANVSTAVATGTWSATLNYWKDSNPGDGLAIGSYVSVPLSGSTAGGADPLVALRSTNPLVYDDLDNTKDLYLFETESTNGYFRSLTSVPTVLARSADAGRTTSAEITGAIQIETTATSPSNASTSLNISVGALTCEAVDRRGV